MKSKKQNTNEERAPAKKRKGSKGGNEGNNNGKKGKGKHTGKTTGKKRKEAAGGMLSIAFEEGSAKAIGDDQDLGP
ncbi:hypothetical protein TIFTF001_033122 [Ficus carica]|uniref:Uncharacterized protein n=1 Tax=Ficus carica TaxID=3494 RepID=A0AA88J3B8_FICCA|nr:hypothetical protein TIFTF001_033122 [Ficus carica]